MLSLGELSDGEIYQMTQLPRSAVEELCELMTDDLQRPSAGVYALPMDTQVLAALVLCYRQLSVDDWAQLSSLAVIRQCGGEQRHQGSSEESVELHPLLH